MKTIRTSFVCGLVLLNAALVPQAGHGQVITGVSIDSASSEWTGGPDMSAVNLVNGSGISSGVQSTSLADMWETQPYQSSAWVVFDLNGLYTVGAFHVWNFN